MVNKSNKNRSNEKKYKFKKSWKYTFNILLLLILVVVIGGFVGVFNTLSYFDSVLDNDFNNIIYSYNDKVSYTFEEISSDNVNVNMWTNEVVVNLDNNNLLVNSSKDKDQILQLINDIEYYLIKSNENQLLSEVQKKDLALYNVRINNAINNYNSDIFRYNDLIKSKYADYMMKFSGIKTKKSILDLEIKDLS